MTREQYAVYLQSPAWRAKREAVLQRCGGRCEDCEQYRRINHFGQRNRAVHVHHLTYDRVGREHLGDLMGLCERHHRIRHDLDGVENRNREAQRKIEAAVPDWDMSDVSAEPPLTIAGYLGVTAKEILPPGGIE